MRFLMVIGYAALLVPDWVWAQETLGGVWAGRYSCVGANDGRLTIELADQADGMVDGTLTFEIQGESGSYHIAGRVLPDGTFTLVPREWIERPTGFTALGAEGRLNPNGRQIEGTLNPCGMGRFSASRELPPTAKVAMAPPEPPAAGPMDGSWQGAVQCRQNRRGAVEVYPLHLVIRSDGANAGALAQLQIFGKFGSGSGPSDEQISILSGSIEGTTLSLMHNLPLSLIRQGTDLRQMQLVLGADGKLTGTMRLNGCETVELQRVGAATDVAVPAQMAGDWVMPTGVDAKTDLTLHISATGDAFAELRARYPLDKPEAARDVLQLVLSPMMVTDRVVVWAPVGYRQATGVFVRGARLYHNFGKARAFTTALLPDGKLAFETPLRGPDIDLALSSPDREAGRGLPRHMLVRVAPDAQLQAGTTPPVQFSPKIGGALASAATREAQCQVVQDWLAPETATIDYDRQSLDEIMRIITPAFDNARFQPVFGPPFLLTTQQERTEIARFIEDACHRNLGMRVIGTIGNRVFRSQSDFSRFAATLANRSETIVWLGGLASELDGLAPDRTGLDRIATLRREADTRRADLTQIESRDIRIALEQRKIELRAGIFLTEAEALPTSGFEAGALGLVLGLMDRMENEGSDIPFDLLRPAREVARQRAAEILNGPIAEAAALAQTIPTSLEGLGRGQAALNPFLPYLAGMNRHFGSRDASGQLEALYTRLDQLRRDPGVVAAFATMLTAIEPKPGLRPSDAVWQVAGRYITQDDLSSAPEMSEQISLAIDLVEVRAIEIVDRSVRISEHEPSAEDIARFALQRVRSYNERMATQEQTCLSGQISDPVQAVFCLNTPALWTGQTGFGFQLLRLEKIGCREDQPGVQYTCEFYQEIDIHFPGGEESVVSTLDQIAREMPEVSQTRFVRNANGGWTGITEVEN